MATKKDTAFEMPTEVRGKIVKDELSKVREEDVKDERQKGTK